MPTTRGHAAFLALAALAIGTVFFWAPGSVERVKEAEAADAQGTTMGGPPSLTGPLVAPFWERFEKENQGGAASDLPDQF